MAHALDPDWHGVIVVTPDVRGGKPRIAGTRITVSDVLGWLATGMTVDAICAEYPSVTPEHIRACLAFAAERDAHVACLVA